MNSAIPPMGPMNLETRRARSLSISSVSSASSLSSRDEAIHNIRPPGAFNVHTASIVGPSRSRAERKAARLARRLAREFLGYEFDATSKSAEKVEAIMEHERRNFEIKAN